MNNLLAIMAAAASAVGVVQFTGYVPPHRAADRMLYEIEAPGGVDLVAAMRGCGIGDHAALGGHGGRQRMQFAVTKDTVAQMHCLGRRMPGATIARRQQWTVTPAAP